MQIDGDIYGAVDEVALVRDFIAWLKERGASYDGWISALGSGDDDISGTFDMAELEAELEKVEAVDA